MDARWCKWYITSRRCSRCTDEHGTTVCNGNVRYGITCNANGLVSIESTYGYGCWWYGYATIVTNDDAVAYDVITHDATTAYDDATANDVIVAYDAATNDVIANAATYDVAIAYVATNDATTNAVARHAITTSDVTTLRPSLPAIKPSATKHVRPSTLVWLQVNNTTKSNHKDNLSFYVLTKLFLISFC